MFVYICVCIYVYIYMFVCVYICKVYIYLYVYFDHLLGKKQNGCHFQLILRGKLSVRKYSLDVYHILANFI